MIDNEKRRKAAEVLREYGAFMPSQLIEALTGNEWEKDDGKHRWRFPE